MACQVLREKGRKAAGEIIQRLVDKKVDKLYKQIKAGSLTGAEARDAVDDLQRVALHDFQEVIGK